MKTKLSLLIVIPVLGLLAACGAVAERSTTAGPALRVQSGSGGVVAGAPAKSATGYTAPQAVTDLPPLPSSQHLEINAVLGIQIPRDSFQDKYGQVLGIITSQHGYLAASNTDTAAAGPRSGTFTFEVPVDSYMTVINQLHALGRYSEHSTTTSHDSQYVDLQARLKSAQSQLAALNTLLAKATTIGDIIAIEQQIAPVQQQIDEIEGQLRYLDSVTQYATVTVTLTEKGAPAPPPLQPGFGDTFQQVLHNLTAIANGFILVVGTLLPFLLLGVAAFATRRRWLPVFVRP